MPTLYGHGILGFELRYGQLNVKTLYMSAVTSQLSLVCFFHGPLYFRHLHPVSFPYEEGVCERFCITLTMPSVRPLTHIGFAIDHRRHHNSPRL